MSVQLGTMILKASIGDITDLTYNSTYNTTAFVGDVLVGYNYIYVVTTSMDMVNIYNKGANGVFGSKYTTVNWYSQDATIGQISITNSSQPYAYTIFTIGTTDYLIGWGSTATVWVWPISGFSISSATRLSYTVGVPNIMSTYGRACWDGGNYVYFFNRNGYVLYSFDLNNRGAGLTQVVTLSGGVPFGSSFTGAAMHIRGNTLFMSSGSNQSDGTGYYDLGTGVYQGRIVPDIVSANLTPAITPISASAGTIIGNPKSSSTVYYFHTYINRIVQISTDYLTDLYIAPITGIGTKQAIFRLQVGPLASGTISTTEVGLVFGTTSSPVIGGAGVTQQIFSTSPIADVGYTYIASALAPGTTYYVRGYSKHNTGTIYYSYNVQFTTLTGLASCSTQAATNIDVTSVTANGTITGISG